jgi:hypothetical protein
MAYLIITVRGVTDRKVRRFGSRLSWRGAWRRRSLTRAARRARAASPAPRLLPASRTHGRRAWSLFALGLNTLRKILAAGSPDQIIAFLAQLLSPKLPVKPLLALAL